jgi:hypothetical protein
MSERPYELFRNAAKGRSYFFKTDVIEEDGNLKAAFNTLPVSQA